MFSLCEFLAKLLQVPLEFFLSIDKLYVYIRRKYSENMCKPQYITIQLSLYITLNSRKLKKKLR